ncbi:MAG TPA: hypothetical protein VLP30_05685, partial [Desulfatirhabdiaceae bacterium]|nr:hypothetical protein [Desulfatirhabdiaceae bacterium]
GFMEMIIIQNLEHENRNEFRIPNFELRSSREFKEPAPPPNNLNRLLKDTNLGIIVAKTT